MKKLIIECNGNIVKVNLTVNNTSIIDSHKIKSVNDMMDILDKIRKSSKEFYAIHHRGIIGMINEWRAHNLLYNLHIKRDRTGTVDLNKDQSIWAKIAYAILSFLYF